MARPATQEEVLRLMKEGWELGMGMGIDGTPWLQRDGLGRSGPTRQVHAASFYALRQKRLIRQVSNVFPLARYVLVEAV